MNTKLKDEKEIKQRTRSWLLKEAPGDHPGSKMIIQQHWSDAADVKEFKNLVLNDNRLIYNKGYALLSREHQKHHFYRIMDFLEKSNHDSIKIPLNEIKIGNKQMYCYIANGNSDFCSRVTLFQKHEKFNENMLGHVMKVNGKFNVYDESEEIIKTLEGNYTIFSGYGFIIFKEM